MRIASIISFLMLAVPSWAVTCKDLGKEVIDKNCTEAYPTCVYANGGQVVGGNIGHHCALCINSRFPNRITQVVPDEGCDEEYRVCAGSRQLAANVEGTACVVCSNSIPTSIDPNDIDDGCPPEANVCVDDAGNSPELYKPGTKCVAKCTNTKVSGKDNGCTTRFPNCLSEGGTNPGIGLAGAKCSACSPALCDDGDSCTDDYCDANGACAHKDNGSCACPNAVDWTCGNPITFCSEDFSCLCDQDTEGAPFCWYARVYCSDLGLCDTSADCGPNTRCATTCCGEKRCLQECDSIPRVRSLRVPARDAQEVSYETPSGKLF